jgi:hypothetical protein
MPSQNRPRLTVGKRELAARYRTPLPNRVRPGVLVDRACGNEPALRRT